MESDSKLICRRGRYYFTHGLEMRDTTRYSNMLIFAYNRYCLDVHSNNQSYAELWIDSNMDIFSHLECKVGGR